MKRKLFYLLVAFLAMAGFQQLTAQTPITKALVVIHAGDLKAAVGKYPGAPTDLNSKLTYSSGIKYAPGTTAAPVSVNTKIGSNDRFDVEEGSGNMITFTSVNGGEKLSLTSGNTTYNQFTVFQDAGPIVQPFADGHFAGYLAVNFSTDMEANGLLLVVQNSSGALKLMTYADYTATTNTTWFPLFVQTEVLSGRWAIPSDFADCKFHSFSQLKLDATDNKVADGTLTVAGVTSFIVKQVDYVESGELGNGSTSTGFIDNEGTLYDATLDANVIPLFTLQNPADCKLVSVSRRNDQPTQMLGNGGFSNKLEFREFGHFEWYDKDGTKAYRDSSLCDMDAANQSKAFTDLYPNATYDNNSFTVANAYEGLQKFAIWIDEDGDYILYPLMSYFWSFGLDLKTEADDIRPNEVLLTNNRESDQNEALKIGYWTGNTTYQIYTGYMGTVPNSIKPISEFETRYFRPDCGSDIADLTGRYFFMQVYNPDVTDLYGKGKINPSYQVNRDYVLSTQVAVTNTQPDPYGSLDGKCLFMVPKEQYIYNEDKSTDESYWAKPADAVNMAAHWEIIKVGDYYKFVNMLGDTLQFWMNGDGYGYLGGGYMTVNSGITNVFNPDAPQDAVHGKTADTQWYCTNDKPATAYNEWKVSKIPGSDNLYTLQLNIPDQDITLSTSDEWGWTNAEVNALKSSVVDSAYYERLIVQKEESPVSGLARYAACTTDPAATLPACSGLVISFEKIGYVPTSEQYIGQGAADNGVINTNDKDFDSQDKLTAYTFLTGVFNIKEALQVDNNLILGAKTADTGAGKTVLAASFVSKDANSTNSVEFIPLTKVAAQRNAQIQSAGGGLTNGVDTLFGETYKWYVVKYNNLYLTFDTLNLASTTTRGMVGLIFDAKDLANATPIRLYQPLVGDKKHDNFLMQFYMPRYTYTANAAGTAFTAIANSFPDIDGPKSANTVVIPSANDGNKNKTCSTDFGVCFATLGVGNSDFINATFANSSLQGARFTFEPQEPTNVCAPNFIDPQWMGEQRLLNLPLNNELWEKGAPVLPNGAWIANGSMNTNLDPNAPAAIVTNAGADKQTTLTHIYVTAIQTYTDDQTYAKVSISGTNTTIGTTWVGGTKNSPLYVNSATKNQSFGTALPVPLYNVTNNAGLYLTVVPDDDLTTLEGATVQDVNGVKLAWLPKYTFATSALRQASVDSLGYDIRALQLFAISGCAVDPVANKYGEFVYLPLASYQWDYNKNQVVTTPALKKNKDGKFADINAVFYNEHLGESMGVGLGNDLRQCWRIAQFASTGGLEKNLVVFNSFNSPTGGNMTPIQVKWSKEGYVQPPCDKEYMLVQKLAPKAANSFFFSVNNHLSTADENTFFAHWQAVQDSKDEFLYTFAPEIQKVYDKEVGVGKAFNQTQLTGQYYFINDTTKVNGVNAYLAIDVSGYANDDFTPKFDTLQMTCVGHDMPFFDFEKAGYDLTSPVALIESFECDRTMDMINSAYPEGIQDMDAHNKLEGFRLLIRLITDRSEFTDAKYVNIYAENRREITPLIDGDETHVIPYYAFSIKQDGKEYFLNVDPTKDYKINWDTITAAQLEILKAPDVAANQNEMKYFKFCFPYKRNADSTLYATALNGQHPVHMQTLDTAVDDYPWLVNASLVTGLTTANQLNSAIPGTVTPWNSATNCLWANIYTVDYSQIDQSKANAWVFNGKQTGEQIWVPIAGLVTNDSISKTRDGAFTTYNNGSMTGSSFITKATDPDFFGKLMGTNLASNVTVVYGGRSMIGDWTKRPIWYYRIKLDDLYLTDATATSKDTYTLSGTPYFIAEFVDMIPNNKAYAQAAPLDSVLADKNFNQTFGFLYATTSDDPDQPFYIVSNANAFDSNVKAKDYRYLASVNERLVFVSGDSPEDAHALAFQWGNLDDENGYTNLEVVGAGNIYGVDGGIKCVNTTGKVDIYSIDGRLIKSAVLTGSDQTIPAPRGIAIVKSGSKVVKVVVR